MYSESLHGPICLKLSQGCSDPQELCTKTMHCIHIISSKLSRHSHDTHQRWVLTIFTFQNSESQRQMQNQATYSNFLFHFRLYPITDLSDVNCKVGKPKSLLAYIFPFAHPEVPLLSRLFLVTLIWTNAQAPE